MGKTGYTPDHWTELVIDAIVIPREADWSITETKKPRKVATLEENINGTMRAMYGVNPANRMKFDFSWSCSQGRYAPAIDDSGWAGTPINAVPITPFRQKILAGNTTVNLIRPVWSNTLVLFDDLLGSVLVGGTDYNVNGQAVTLSAARTGRVICVYRAQLAMMVDDWSITNDERQCLCSWDLSAKEV